MDYLSNALTFIIGGGLYGLINWRITKKSQKVDFADKAIAFMEKQNDGLMKRVTALEAEVRQLSKFKCDKPDCPQRVNI